MKKLVISLTVAAFALGSALQAGESQPGSQSKPACCEKEKAACPAQGQAGCAEKAACPMAGKVAQDKSTKAKTAKAKTVKAKNKASKSSDQASTK